MALTILNNIAALAAQNQLNITSSNLQSTLEQLSSGSRINSGADDPAGLAIANGLSANIAALTQSASNATGGIGELQVADGALSQVTTLLNRAVTLATESATGTVSNSQRLALDNEYQSIKTEINSIGSTTNYNGGQVFTVNTLNVFLGDGSATGSSQIGVTTGQLSANDLNLGGAVAATGTLAEAAGSAATPASNILTGDAFTAAVVATGVLTAAAPIVTGTTETIGTGVDAQVYTFETALVGGGAANQVWIGANGNVSAFANLVSAINGATGIGTNYGNGTTANVNVTAAITTQGTANGGTPNVLTVTSNINGIGDGSLTGNSVATTSTSVATWGAVHLANGAAGDTVTVGGKIYTFVAALASTPTANEVVSSSEATGLANLVLAVNEGTGAGTLYGTGTVQNANVTAAATAGHLGTEDTFTANVAGVAGNNITGVLSAGAGGFTQYGFLGGANAGAAPVATAGDTVTVGTQQYSFVAALTIPTANAVQVLVGATEATSLQNLANAVNGGSGAGEGYAYGSAATANTSATAVAGATSVVFSAITKGATGNGIISTTTGSGANTFAGSLLSGGAAGSVNDLLTQPDAQAALSLIDGAVAAVAALRGNIGSTVNRLQSASNVITNQVQNLTAAENNVTAADIPTVVANLTQFSILEQTGISALTQANQQQQLVLKLLQ
jgi:flagellin